MLGALPASKWNYSTAAHLLNRAGFGGTPVDVQRLQKLGLDGAVSWLVDFEQIPDPTSAPSWAKPDPDRAEKLRDLMQLRRKMKDASEAERKEMEVKGRELLQNQMRSQVQHMVELRGWWLERMAKGPRPLEEKLTLFWHGHFATSVQKVRDPYLMWLQNETFRRNCASDWLTMLTEVTKDPAMLVWLDQAQSRKAHPNENYAREVMELFALGEGHYTEKDIAEAARAFTGLSYDRLLQTSTYRAFIHDAGLKIVLGKSGPLTYEDVLETIVQQPQSARFISSRLWTFFSGQTPSDELAVALAEVFRSHGNNFKPLLKVIFRSEQFYDPSVVRNQVKSPVQWLVASVRMLERDLPPPIFAANLLQNLGQELFAPPNVKGWDGGVSWITTNSLLARYNYAEMLVFGTAKLNFSARKNAPKLMEDRFNRRNAKGTPIDVEKFFSKEERTNSNALIAALELRLLQGRLKPRQEQVLRDYLGSRSDFTTHDLLETIRLVMSTPEFQVT
jgi:uncharacterized protein (DUF1800 family)